MWLAAATLLALLHTGLGECFFPFEYHGTYAVQTAPNQYSEVLIEINSILPYGFCHKKVDDNVILRDGSNGCLRCFHMAIRSPNVLQLHTRDPQTSCATNLNATYRLCPTPAELASEAERRRGRVHEIMMYKTKTRSMEKHEAPVFCPISGKFSFSYESETDGAVCPGTSSQLSSNCPYGFGLHLHFRGCSFQHDLSKAYATYQCLADWDDGLGSRYLTLLDVDAAGTGRPRYRCAMYREEVGTGRIFMSFSPDGSCHGRLENATGGAERLVLYAAPSRPWPPAVRRATCTFPEWAQGHWQHAHVSGNTIVYKDVANFGSYTARCVGGGDEKFVIYTRSHCGEETYNCIWLKERSVNVMELQLGLSPSPRISNSLCGPHRFQESNWITQGRQVITEEASCPVSGEYVGTIPDTGGQLCARLASECRRPQIMYYTVTSCIDSTDIYEGSQSSGHNTERRPAIIPISSGSGRAEDRPWQRQGPSGPSREGFSPQNQRGSETASTWEILSETLDGRGSRPQAQDGWNGQSGTVNIRDSRPGTSGRRGSQPDSSDGWGRRQEAQGGWGNSQAKPNSWGNEPNTPGGWGRPAETSGSWDGRQDKQDGWNNRPQTQDGWNTRADTQGSWGGRVEVSSGRAEVSGGMDRRTNTAGGGWGRTQHSSPVGPSSPGRQPSVSVQEASTGRRRWRRDAARYSVSQPRTTRVSYALPAGHPAASSTTSGPSADAYDPWNYQDREDGDSAPPTRDGPRGETAPRRPSEERDREHDRRQEQERRPTGADGDRPTGTGAGERRDPVRGQDTGTRDENPGSARDRDRDRDRGRNWGTDGRDPSRYPDRGRSGDGDSSRRRDQDSFGDRDRGWPDSRDRDPPGPRDRDPKGHREPTSGEAPTAASPNDWNWTPVKDLTPDLNPDPSVTHQKPRQETRHDSERRPEQSLRPGSARAPQWTGQERDAPRGSFSGGWPVQPPEPRRPVRPSVQPPPRRPALPAFDPTPQPSFIGESRPVATPAPAATTTTAKTAKVPPGYREERQYRCLGTWQEDGVLYTYTQRLDALSYECFAGRVMPDGRVFIGDAGTQQGCRRAVDPATSGMLIKSIAPCPDGEGTASAHSGDSAARLPSPDPPPSDRRARPELEYERPAPDEPERHPPDIIRRPPTTARSWRPITARPDRRSSASRHQMSASALAGLVAALLLLRAAL